MKDHKDTKRMAYEKPSSSSSFPADNSVSLRNKFRNDGSFLELFKKMQSTSAQIYGIPPDIAGAVDSSGQQLTEDRSGATDGTRSDDATDQQPSLSATSKSSTVLVGRRKSGRPLPVGKVKKSKTDDDAEDGGAVSDGRSSGSKDAWAKYLEEVKKYKETYCESESRNRSLVK